MKIAIPLISMLILLASCGSPAEKSISKAERVDPPSTTKSAMTDESSNKIEVSFASLPSPYNDANYDNGKRVYRLCVSCHLLNKDGGHRVGPNLHRIIGRKAGTVEGFRFSRVVMDSDIVWTPEKIDEWLSNPRSFLPGNRMSFSGVRRPQDRQDVIAYIMLESAKD